MTLVKTKIVADSKGTTIYMWQKTWWIFGYWYPFGCTTKIITEKTINDNSVSELLFGWFKF